MLRYHCRLLFIHWLFLVVIYCVSKSRKIFTKNRRFSCQFKYVFLPLLAKILSVTQWNN